MKKRSPQLNEALRLLRVFYDMPRSELLDKLQISNSYLSEIESGKKTVTIELLQKYSEVFQLPPSALLFFSEHLENTGVSERARKLIADKVLRILDWVASKDELRNNENPA
jgi:transcriptional regulator with XRE-family HTH domain